jgi:hypothetical protein
VFVVTLKKDYERERRRRNSSELASDTNEQRNVGWSQGEALLCIHATLFFRCHPKATRAEKHLSKKSEERESIIELRKLCEQITRYNFLHALFSCSLLCLPLHVQLEEFFISAVLTHKELVSLSRPCARCELHMCELAAELLTIRQY